MFQKTAKIFLFLSVFFFFGHSFTAHAHAENGDTFVLHEHQDASDFFSCLFSIDLGENHLSVYSEENNTEYDFCDFLPDFCIRYTRNIPFEKIFVQKEICFFKKSNNYLAFFSKNVPSRAPPLA
jgi:hypothetical protein